MFGLFDRGDDVSCSSTLGSASTRGWHQHDAGINLSNWDTSLDNSQVMVPSLDSIPVRLIIPHTITLCIVGGPTGEGRPMRARPCDGFMGSSDLGTRHPNFHYSSGIRLTSLSRSFPWLEGIAS
ncbi:hypothetical protein TIFTF001_027776 [Ficus carica]|uniref:Uncharacterized protein n=1 Tax=Ficus carica TaxID=3494 RepID=A0AA88J0Q9_FICCA|nr:hypothetical protein TIFTF001_027776 [Ficus carica]